MKLKLILGLILSGICIVYVFYRIDFKQLISALNKADMFNLSIAVLFVLMTQVIRSLRWKLLLSSIKLARVINLLSAISIGAMADMIFPARIGDIIRAGIIGNKEKVSKMSSLATIVTERVFDVITALLILLTIVIFYKFPSDSVGSINALKTAGGVTAAVSLGVIVFLLILKNKTDAINRLIISLRKFIPDKMSVRLSEALISFASGLQSIQFSWRLCIILLYSIILWSAFAISNLFVLRALNFNYHIATAYYILLFQVLGVTLPSSPGFIGTYHAAVVTGLSIFGVSFEHALGTAILMHAVFFFPFIAFGLLFLWMENLSFADIRSIK